MKNFFNISQKTHYGKWYNVYIKNFWKKLKKIFNKKRKIQRRKKKEEKEEKEKRERNMKRKRI